MNFAELRVQKSAPWLKQKKMFWRYPRCLKGQKKYLFWQYPRCFMGYCLSQGADFGNTEVVPWDLGKNIFVCRYQARRNLHVDLGTI